MSPPADQTSSTSIIPLPVLGLLLVSCTGLSWLMVPKRGEMLERLLKDRQYERVATMLRNQVDGITPDNVAQLRRVNSSQFSAISHLLNLTPREQLQSVFTSKRLPDYDLYIHYMVLGAVRYVNVLPPSEALALIEPGLGRVPETYRLQLLRLLAQNAFGSSRPEVAAKCLKLACQGMNSDWATALEMVQAYRWSSQGEEGFHQLEAWLGTHRSQLTEEQKKEADEVLYATALETGNPGLAFDLCLRQMSAEGGAPSQEVMERAYSAALQSNRSRELIPWLEKFVQAMPSTNLPLADLYRSSGNLSPELKNYQHWSQILGQWSDWNESYDTAFTMHMRLASMGDPASLTRCLALYDFLGRTEECCELLLILKDTPEGQKNKRHIAQLLAELGEDEKSKTYYEACLQEKPEDRDLLFEYGSLYEDMGDEPASRRIFEKLVKLHPQDEAVIKKLAEACIRDADYPAALALYNRLPEAAHNHDTLENYAMIAESLDDYAAEFRALRMDAKISSTPSVETYLNLAETATHLPEEGLSVEVLKEGLQRLPDSAQLRLALAGNLLDSQRIDEGLDCIYHESVRGNYEAVQMILALSDNIPDPREALSFMGAKLEIRYPLTSVEKLQLGVISYKAGDRASCQRLFASVPENTETRRALAGSYFAIGEPAEALHMMEGYLHDNHQVSAADYVLLGDIYEQMGRSDEAVKAYDYSLTLLTADLPDTAFN